MCRDGSRPTVRRVRQLSSSAPTSHLDDARATRLPQTVLKPLVVLLNSEPTPKSSTTILDRRCGEEYKCLMATPQRRPGKSSQRASQSRLAVAASSADTASRAAKAAAKVADAAAKAAQRAAKAALSAAEGAGRAVRMPTSKVRKATGTESTGPRRAAQPGRKPKRVRRSRGTGSTGAKK